MAILLDKSTRLIVQGLTGREGTFHAKQAQAYGTNVVGGVTPGKGGTTHEGWPVFNTVADAVKATGANTSVIFVPAAFAADAVMEGAEAGLRLVVCITEGIPTLDMMRALTFLKDRPRRASWAQIVRAPFRRARRRPGSFPGTSAAKGASASCRRAARSPTRRFISSRRWGWGSRRASASAAIRSSARRSSMCLTLFADDPETDAVVMIGEIGGTAEEEAAAFIQKSFKKPVVGFIAGQTAPPGRRMGHAGAIIAGGKGTAAEKMAALAAAGVTVVKSPADMGTALKGLL